MNKTAQHLQFLDPKVISKLNNIEIKARMIVEGFITGLHKSPFHGFSVEFAEHRPYNNGEPLKNIDWKVYGKTDKLFTRKYEEETNLRCYIALDVSDSMRYPTTGISKLEYSAYLAAAFSYLMVQQRDAVGLTLFDNALRYYARPKSRQSYLIQLFKELEQVVAQKASFNSRSAQAPVIHQLAQKISRRGLVILLTDFFSNIQPLDELFPALQHLRHNNHDVMIFHILHRATETQFDFPNQPLILRDLETNEQIHVQPQQIKPYYQEMLQEYTATIKRKCREFNIELIEIDTDTPYDKALTDYLVKRKIMYK